MGVPLALASEEQFNLDHRGPCGTLSSATPGKEGVGFWLGAEAVPDDFSEYST